MEIYFQKRIFTIILGMCHPFAHIGIKVTNQHPRALLSTYIWSHDMRSGSRDRSLIKVSGATKWENRGSETLFVPLQQVRDKPQNAVIVINGIMVKAGHTVRCHIWHHCQ